MKDQDHLVFVYGTLRPGKSANEQMSGAENLGGARTAPRYNLATHQGSRALKRGGGNEAVQGQLYRVSAAHLAKLDDWEREDFEPGEIELADGRMARTWFLKESRRPSTKKLILQGNTLPELMAERQRWSLKNKPLEPGETKVDRIRKLRGINRDIAQEWGRQDKGWALVVNGQYVKPQDWDMPAEIITPTGLVNDLRTASMVMRNKLFSGYQLVPIGIDEADEIRGYLR